MKIGSEPLGGTEKGKCKVFLDSHAASPGVKISHRWIITEDELTIQNYTTQEEILNQEGRVS